MTATTPTADALIAAVLANPADDTPRLVYADCCEEQGQLERAKLIRLMIDMERHTDCPLRMEYTARRLPVPLRCGQCNYCRGRRACEAFRGGWLPGDIPYSYSVDPTPFDQVMPHRGTHLTIRRGFVQAVHCTLAAWVGEPCQACNGTGNSDEYVPSNLPLAKCRQCKGGRYVGGIGPRIVRCQPVTAVVLTCREPSDQHFSREHGRWFWLREYPGMPLQRHHLPAAMFDLLDGGTRYTVFDADSTHFESGELARSTASAAALTWARGQPV